MTFVPIRRALLSVSDKTGLVDFARFLAAAGVELLSTGGTAQTLIAAGIPVKEVSDYTGFPEMLDGRVKTLHPRVHGGLLGIRGNPAHEAAMNLHGIAPIDLLVVNLYPFEKTVEQGSSFEECLENIDVGGPALIRGAAKNHASVAVVVDVEDYAPVMAEMKANTGATTLETRRRLAAIAYARTGAYDAAIASWLAAQTGETHPRRMVFAGTLKQTLRYGENPHQSAAFYVSAERRPGVASAIQRQGKELSYNNYNDIDAAFELVSEFSEPAVVIVKHANPCGVAIGASLTEAYERAFHSDPVSPFGGIVACNRPLDAEAAEAVSRIFTEAVIAPGADAAAQEVFARKKNLRLLLSEDMPDPRAPGTALRSLSGGYLLQSRDVGRISREDLKIVTKRIPTEQEMEDMVFGFRVVKYVKSNAVLYAKNKTVVAIGAGQTSRVDAARLAVFKAETIARAEKRPETGLIGSTVASDAYFPFADGLIAAVEAGATAVVQPGGSIRDAEVVEAADQAGIAMAFTGMRHFRH